MKERPILFSGAMVRAILDDKKTQTRRVMKPQPRVELDGADKGWRYYERAQQVYAFRIDEPIAFPLAILYASPYGTTGDRLWVRETWDDYGTVEPMIVYRADYAGENNCPVNPRWRPSIHMPRWASRLLLENVAVRVERLQDISDADILAEGFPEDPPSYAEGFAAKWNEINPKHPWEGNPWVWVVEFKRIEASI